MKADVLTFLVCSDILVLVLGNMYYSGAFSFIYSGYLEYM